MLLQHTNKLDMCFSCTFSVIQRLQWCDLEFFFGLTLISVIFWVSSYSFCLTTEMWLKFEAVCKPLGRYRLFANCTSESGKRNRNRPNITVVHQYDYFSTYLKASAMSATISVRTRSLQNACSCFSFSNLLPRFSCLLKILCSCWCVLNPINQWCKWPQAAMLEICWGLRVHAQDCKHSWPKVLSTLKAN